MSEPLVDPRVMHAIVAAPRRPRVLQLSYACSPSRGSEAATGWQRAVRSAKYFDTWVICEEHEFADEIRSYTAAHGEIPGLRFVFVPIDQREWALGQHHDLLWYAVLRRWHRRAFETARRLNGEIGFDLAHLVTFCGYREPSDLWRLDVPFVWGPIGGTQNYPWRFLSGAGLRGAIHESCRSVMNRLQLRWSPRVRAACRRAAVVLAANATVEQDLIRAQGIRPRTMFESGLAGVRGAPRTRESRGPAIRILWSGLLIHRKALHLLLRALARLPADVPYELKVLGDGAMRRPWQRLAQRLGIAPHVTWMGWVPHQESMRQYEWADLFVFTSLRDTSGNVVLEAMAAGVPAVCLDHHGIREIVTDHCGIKVPVTTPREVIARIAESVAHLSRDLADWERLSRGAIARAGEYLWSQQELRMAGLYREILARKQDGEKANHRTARGPQDIGSETVGAAGGVAVPSSQGNLAASVGHASKDHPFGILMYHRVTPAVSGAPSPTWNVTPSQFRRQLAGLLARGWRAWPLRQVLACRKAGEPIPPRTFVVTFDDGYDNVYQNAWPVLKELSVPATVFVVTDCLGSDRPFRFDNWEATGSVRVPAETWRPLTVAHCREMAASGLVEIGSHTHTHADMRGSPDLLREDVARSVEVLRARFGMKDVSFAFPFGYAEVEMRAVARELGVACALTTEPETIGPGADPFAWGRFAAAWYDTPTTLALKLGGWYSELRTVWRWLRRPWAFRNSGRGDAGPKADPSRREINMGRMETSR
ncbi:MAG: glycosyltransferase [Thermoguttaceae bacterium]